MNLNERLPCHAKNKGKSCSVKVVPVQAPLGPPQKRAPKRISTPSHSSNASRIQWKNNTISSGTGSRLDTGRSPCSSHTTESRIVIALSEGRGGAMRNVGIAALNMECPSVILCQITDSRSYVNTLTKINILNPSEILIPVTFVNSCTTNRLIEKLKEQFSHIKISGVTRKSFNNNTGLQYIKRLCVSNMNAILLVIQHKYYALAAAGALLTYAETTLYVMYAKESIKVEYQESEGCAIIDVVTADKLELIACARPSMKKKYSCLFDILNYTYTRAGALALRATILQPPCKVPDIEARLNCVTELIEHGEMLTALQVTLQKVKSVDQLLSLVIVSPDQTQNYSERQLNYLLRLNSILAEIPHLKEAFKNSKQPFFIEVRNMLNDTTFSEIKQLIRTMINTDAHPGKGKYGIIQRCFAIKYGISPLLDLIRNSYSEKVNELIDYVKGLAQKYSLSLTLNNTTKKGYHIVLALNSYQQKNLKKSDLPHEFILAERMSRSYVLKTVDLINLSHRIEDINLEILKLSNIMINKLLIEVRKYAGLFYTLCENIAKVDMIQSLAQASTVMQYVRPNFSNYLEILHGRHPLLNFLLPVEPVANSILTTEDHNMHIITGPNGSGKSIFIRQIVLLQIMAQVGCYVPAKSATFRVADRILARISFDDNMACGASTFVVEMKDIQYFLTVMSKNSLVIADELCRSTSLGEGTALAMAICERLKETPAFVFCTTHFKLMSKLYDLYMNVKVWQLETLTEIIRDQVVLKFTYNLIPNPTSIKHYGIFLAKASWSQHVIKYAEEILQHSSSQTMISPVVKTQHPARRLKYDLEANLKLLKKKGELKDRINEYLLNFENDLQKLNCHLNLVRKGPGKNVCDLQPTNRAKYTNCNEMEEQNLSRDISLMPQEKILNRKEIYQNTSMDYNNQSLNYTDMSITQMLVPDNSCRFAPNFEHDSNIGANAELSDIDKNESCLSMRELNLSLNFQQGIERTSTPLILKTQENKPFANVPCDNSKVLEKNNVNKAFASTHSSYKLNECNFKQPIWTNTLSSKNARLTAQNKGTASPTLTSNSLRWVQLPSSKVSTDPKLQKIEKKHAVNSQSPLCTDEEVDKITAELESYSEDVFGADPWANETLSQCHKSVPSKGSTDPILWKIEKKHAVNPQSPVCTDEEVDKITAQLESGTEDVFGADPWANETLSQCHKSVPSKGSTDPILWKIEKKHAVNPQSPVCTDEEVDKITAELESGTEDDFGADPWANETLSHCHKSVSSKGSTDPILWKIEKKHTVNSQSPVCTDEEVDKITAELESGTEGVFGADPRVNETQASSTSVSSHFGYGGFQKTVTAEVHHIQHSPYDELQSKYLEKNIINTTSMGADNTKKQLVVTPQCNSLEVLTIKHRPGITHKLSPHGSDIHNVDNEDSSIFLQETQPLIIHSNCSQNEEPITLSKSTLDLEKNIINTTSMGADNTQKQLVVTPQCNSPEVLTIKHRPGITHKLSPHGRDINNVDNKDSSTFLQETQPLIIHSNCSQNEEPITLSKSTLDLEKNIINTTAMGADNTKKQSVVTPQCNSTEVLTIKHRPGITHKLSPHGRDINNVDNNDSSTFLQETQPLIVHSNCSQNEEPITSSKSTLTRGISINNSIAIPSKVNTTLEPLGDIHLELFGNSSQEQENSIYKTPQSSRDFPTLTSRNKMKWNPPYQTTSTISTVSKNKRKLEQLTTPIPQPKKLTKKEIQQCFHEQDKALLSRSDYDPRLAEYIINRPNVKQIQGMEYIVSVQRTNEGVIVQPFIRDKKKHDKKKFVTPLLGKPSPAFDIQMFSDKNATKFEEFMNSKKKASPSNRQERTSFEFSVCGSAHTNDEATTTDEDIMKNFGRNTRFLRDKKKHDKKKFVAPLLGKPSPAFDIQMFSDNNATKFEEFMNSKKKASPSNRQEPTSFEFSVCGSAHRNDEATKKTDEDIIKDFGRNIQNSKTFLQKLQESSAIHSQPLSEIDHSNPGYYTQNREHIESVVSKYSNKDSNDVTDIFSFSFDFPMESLDSFSQSSGKFNFN